MRRALVLALALTLPPAALAQDPVPAPAAPFPDVPPCHWAAPAVARLASAGIVEGAPAAGPALAENAVRQVLEGLRCGDPAWAARFLTDLPPELERAARDRVLTRFDLRVLETRVSGSTATVRFRLTTTVAGEPGRDRTHEAVARLSFDPRAGWRVRPAAGLFLPARP